MAAFGAAAAIAERDITGGFLKERFKQFLLNFEVLIEDPNSPTRSPTRVKEYSQQIDAMVTHDLTTMFVDYTQLHDYDATLGTGIKTDFYRFEPFLRRALQEIIKERHEDFLEKDGSARQFFVSFFNLPTASKIRDLKMNQLGSLVAVRGTVTRTTEVRPELLYGVFTCEECGNRSPEIEQQFKYTEPTMCHADGCGNRTRWRLDAERSKFVDWQRGRVQENSDEIPPGSMPRTLDVIFRGLAVERAKAGDKCTFVGTFIVVPDVSALYRVGSVPTAVKRSAGGRAGAGAGAGDGLSGLKALGARDLTYRTAFLVQSVKKTDSSDPRSIMLDDEQSGGDGRAYAEVSEEDKAEYYRMAQSRGEPIEAKLISSVVPAIHGHAHIKKGLLLMLLGGVHKVTPDRIRLRGDINMCIIGDPSTAKSQFLKYVKEFHPKAVYTSGKASSAAGLTASVAKDPDTGEFTVEAGALMLADNAICCIDEFDKMESTDQVAIHEAMEQQTITVTKAGISATLNARTSILAAANPLFGRYDRTKTLRENVNISQPIMSRFDLFFVVLDEPDEARDAIIADHIVKVHQKKTSADAFKHVIPMQKLRGYVNFARSLMPRLGGEAREEMTRQYQLLRQQDAGGGSGRAAYRITVRQLEALVRLSEALARLHLREVVTRADVQQAADLLRRSVVSVQQDDVDLGADADADLDADLEAQYEAAEAAAAAAAMQEDDEGEGGDNLRTPTRPAAAGGAEEKKDDDDDEAGDGRGAGAGAGAVRRKPGRKSRAEGAEATPTTLGAAARAHQIADAVADGLAPKPSAAAAAAAAEKEKEKDGVRISFSQYSGMRRALLLRLKQQEESASARLAERYAGVVGVAAYATRPTDAELSLPVSDLIGWYMETQEFEDAEAAQNFQLVCYKVVKRMLQKDAALVFARDDAGAVLRRDRTAEEEAEDAEAEADGSPDSKEARGKKKERELLRSYVMRNPDAVIEGVD